MLQIAPVPRSSITTPDVPAMSICAAVISEVEVGAEPTGPHGLSSLTESTSGHEGIQRRSGTSKAMNGMHQQVQQDSSPHYRQACEACSEATADTVWTGAPGMACTACIWP